MPSTKEIYDTAIRPLPPKERLHLAALILSDLTAPDAEPIEFGNSWSAEDLRDLTDHAVAEADTSYPKNKEIV